MCIIPVVFHSMFFSLKNTVDVVFTLEHNHMGVFFVAGASVLA